MPIRTHIGRHFDLRLPSNLALAGLVALSAGTALVLWLNGSPPSIFLAPVFVFLIWALLREVDPDNWWTAVLGGVFGGAWVLAGRSVTSALAYAGLMLAARLVTETTGRRPLPVDLGVVAMGGIAVGFTIEGWVAGFGLALAIYLDDRLDPGPMRGMQVAAAAATAVGTTVVGAAAGAFPERMPDIVPYLVISAGVIALLLVIREPVAPTSQVDARHRAFMRQDRLHASRALVGILMFAMTLLLGGDADGVVPLGVALLLALVSNEVERLRRPDL